MPKDKKNLPKKQAKRGNFPLPVDVIDELRDWKRAYELAWSDPAPQGKQYTMTNEQLIRRLLEGVKRLDPEVWAVHEAREKTRQEQDEMMADFKKSFWPELMRTRKKVNMFYDEMIGEITKDEQEESDSPTSIQVKEKEQNAVPETAAADPTESDFWDMRYFFKKDGEELEAFAGDIAPFYCEYNGQNTGMNKMFYQGWRLFTDTGIELTKEQAVAISNIIKMHKAEKA